MEKNLFTSHVKLAQHQKFNKLAAQLHLSKLFHDRNHTDMLSCFNLPEKELHFGDSCQVRKNPMAALTSSSGSHSAAVTPCIHHNEGNKTSQQSGWGSAARWRLLVLFFFCLFLTTTASLINIWKLDHAALSKPKKVSMAGSDDVEAQRLFLFKKGLCTHCQARFMSLLCFTAASINWRVEAH